MARLSIITFLSFCIVVCTAKRGGGGSSSSSKPSCQSIDLDVTNRTIQGVAWEKSGDTEALIIDNDDSTRNVLNKATSGINTKFNVYDAFYFGSLTVAVTPPTTGNQSSCSPITFSVHDAYLRIGPQTREGLTRKAFASNPFYLDFGRANSCPGSFDLNLESSNDEFTNGQVWSLGSTISADSSEMNFSGNLTSTKANYGNYFLYDRPPSTQTCPAYFYLRSMRQSNRVSLHGTASRSTAEMTFSIASGPTPTSSGPGSGVMPPTWPEGWVANGTFSGSWSTTGAAIVLTNGILTTEGDSKKKKNVTGIIIAVCLGVAGLLALLLCCWCCCIRPRRQQRKNADATIPS